MRITLLPRTNQHFRSFRMWFPKLNRNTIRILYVLFGLYMIILLGYIIRRSKHAQHYYLFNSVESHCFDEELDLITKEGQSRCPKTDASFCPTPCWSGRTYLEPGFVVTPNITKHKNSDLVVTVYSALGNIAKRKNIRDEFFEAMKHEKDVTVSLAFIVGLPTEKDIENNRHVQQEHKIYNDILQINITDIYNHLGYKGIAGLKWTMETRTPNTKQYDIEASEEEDFHSLDNETLVSHDGKELSGNLLFKDQVAIALDDGEMQEIVFEVHNETIDSSEDPRESLVLTPKTNEKTNEKTKCKKSSVKGKRKIKENMPPSESRRIKRRYLLENKRMRWFAGTCKRLGSGFYISWDDGEESQMTAEDIEEEISQKNFKFV